MLSIKRTYIVFFWHFITINIESDVQFDSTQLLFFVHYFFRSRNEEEQRIFILLNCLKQKNLIIFAFFAIRNKFNKNHIECVSVCFLVSSPQSCGNTKSQKNIITPCRSLKKNRFICKEKKKGRCQKEKISEFILCFFFIRGKTSFLFLVECVFWRQNCLLVFLFRCHLNKLIWIVRYEKSEILRKRKINISKRNKIFEK